MASNPPFQLEDQTDEDFFDKLVDDDFMGPTELAPKFADGSDSDDARAFANLSINDVGNAFEDLDVVTGSQGKGQNEHLDVDPVKLGAHAEESNFLLSSSSIGCDNAAECVNEGVISELAPDSMASNGLTSSIDGIVSEVKVDNAVDKSNDSGGSKEVGWSSFYADSVQNGGHGFGSDSDFFNDLGNEAFSGIAGNKLVGEANIVSGNEESTNKSVDYLQYKEDQIVGSYSDQSTTAQDVTSSQDWENLYPGWRYDSVSGQWYQVEGFDATANVLESVDTKSSGQWDVVSDGNIEVSHMQEASTFDPKMEVSYMQQSQSIAGTVTESSTPGVASNWHEASQVNNGYPEHMFFDPQYPGWYYDTIAQEWRLLESYDQSIHSNSQVYDLHNKNAYILPSSDSSLKSDYVNTESFGLQNVYNQGQDNNWAGSYDNNNVQNLSNWQTEAHPSGPIAAETNWQTEAHPSKPIADFSGIHQSTISYGSNVSVGMDHQKSFSSFAAVPSQNQPSQGHGEMNGAFGLPSFIPRENFSHQYDPGNISQNKETFFSNESYATQKPIANFQQSFQNVHNSSYAPSMGRSSAGRPPHALVTFGFGGKLIVMKDNSSFGNLSTGNQNPVGGSISVLNLMDVVTAKTETSSFGPGSCNYFSALCQQSFPGPLVGSSVGNKELNKWVDERISKCESLGMDYKKGEAVRLLLTLLKIACQHYGKLRSPFGTDGASRENDSPESAVAKLFASAKSNDARFNGYGNVHNCLQKLPSEGQIKATASEVQNLLVSGRKKEALQRAQEGQLWGPALVLASQLGDQFYVDTVKQMALRELVAGTPLRTLCLLIAGQPAEVFSTESSTQSLPTANNMYQNPLQYASNSMLDDWEENLAVITANRTKDDELVIIHLGDCLWKERSEITAAHICYLVAEANFESYSDSARLCLIGSDHWKSPRTYASPEAIQRTELYEYSKVLGNSQFILLPFQPYKLIYAHMLAEVGKVSDSLKYCQAVSRALKTGRSPEVEMWKQLVSSLEERIKVHQQGGYTANLAPGKLVGKLLNFFDSTAHRVVGGLPPTVPSHVNLQGNEKYHQPAGHRASASMSTMDMSSFMPSASVEPINEKTADGPRMTMPNRSISEPDFGRTPRQDQVDPSKGNMPSNVQGKASDTVRSSRLSRFGFGTQLLQKTVGLVMRPRQGRQAKLGDENKFYYDEKLKRWVEEGVEPPAEAAALPPPPTSAAFQNGITDYNLKSALNEASPTRESSEKLRSSIENTPGIPPIAPSSNQFSARGRMGVRSRYVDTFNQGGGSKTNLFQSPSVPAAKPAVAANTKFFIPSPVSSGEQAMEAIAESAQEETSTTDHPPSTSSSTINNSFHPPSTSSSTINNSFHSPPPQSTPTPMLRFPSMGNIPGQGVKANNNSSFASHSRRAASWSGSFSDAQSPSKMVEAKPLGHALGNSPSSSYMQTGRPAMHMPMNGSSPGFGDELHEVEL